MSREVQLIQELMHNAQASGNRIMERRLADLTVWYYKNRDSIAPDNLAARERFLEKTIWILIEVMALQAERLHELEGRGRSKNLYLPRGVMVNGSVKEYG